MFQIQNTRSKPSAHDLWKVYLPRKLLKKTCTGSPPGNMTKRNGNTRSWMTTMFQTARKKSSLTTFFLFLAWSHTSQPTVGLFMTVNGRLSSLVGKNRQEEKLRRSLRWWHSTLFYRSWIGTRWILTILMLLFPELRPGCLEQLLTWEKEISCLCTNCSTGWCFRVATMRPLLLLSSLVNSSRWKSTWAVKERPWRATTTYPIFQLTRRWGTSWRKWTTTQVYSRWTTPTTIAPTVWRTIGTSLQRTTSVFWSRNACRFRSSGK